MLILAPGQLGLLCQRRSFLRRGAGLAAGSFLAPWLAGGANAQERADSPEPETPALRPGAVRSCILVYLLGGPPQLDTFDLKPEAPAEIRGPFRPIATTVPGLEICEHLPRLARRAQHYSVIRSVSHPNSNHTPMIYYTLTGYHTELPAQDNDIRPPLRTDFPHLGSVVARFAPARGDLPSYVALPELAIRSSTEGEFKRARSPLRGGGGGFLGALCDPLTINGPPGTTEAIPALQLPAEVTRERSERRAALMTLLDGGRAPSATNDAFRLLRQQALVLTGARHSPTAELFSLDREPAATHERYGPHRFGKSLLLARRLTEAGVPLVAVHFNEMTVCDGWDTHSKNFEGLQSELLPMLDQGLSALLDDLLERGRLDETLIVVMGEFGRTPKINANAGRDHWGDCSSVLLAGGGLRGGQVIGRSDRHAAFPLDRRVDPIDLQATIYDRLGLDPKLEMRDHLNRPFAISQGRVVRELG